MALCKWKCGTPVVDTDECGECLQHNLEMDDCDCDPDGIAVCKKHVKERLAEYRKSVLQEVAAMVKKFPSGLALSHPQFAGFISRDRLIERLEAMKL